MRRFPEGPSDRCFGLRLIARMRRDVLGTYHWLNREYGDQVSYRVGPYRLFVYFHPDQVREVLVTQAKGTIRNARVMATLAQWNGDSILIAEGEDWVRQRRLVQPAFHPRRLEGYAQTIVKATIRLADSWTAEVERLGYHDLEINETMTGLTLETICRALFNVGPRSESPEIAAAVKTLSEVAFYEMQSPFRMSRWWPTRRYRRKRWAMAVLDKFVWNIVRTRRAENRDHGDLLSMLLAAVDEDGEGRLTDKQVRDEAMTLMLAGHDTTAAGLDWLWYLLATHPEIADRCRTEMASVLHNRRPTAEDVSRLPYTEAVVKESLRLYPPAIGVFLRQASRDLVIGGYDVPRNSLLTLSSVVTHRDPRWFRDPDRFDPERFLPPLSADIPNGAYFPFGLGPRVCIGQNFAMTEMILIAATLLPMFNVAPAPNQSEPIPFVHLALRPQDPLWLRWTPRGS
jgi:cytochrome P450